MNNFARNLNYINHQSGRHQSDNQSESSKNLLVAPITGSINNSNLSALESADNFNIFSNKSDMAAKIYSGILVAFVSALFLIVFAVKSYGFLTPRLTSNIPVGAFPYGVAFAANSNYALVADSDSNDVSVVSMATKGVVASIKVGSHPAGVAISPSLAFAYVCNVASGNISVLNMSTLTKSLNISVGGGPVNVAFTPNSKLAFAANIGNNQVDVINTVQNAVTKRINVGKSPSGIAVSPNGKIAVVTNAGGSTFTVIDISSLNIIRTIQTGKNPTSVAFSPADSPKHYIYIASGKGNAIYVYRQKNFAFVRKFKTLTDPSSVAVTPNGMMLFAVNFQNNAVTIYNAVHFNHIKTINLPNGPIAVAVSPDGTAALVTITSASSAAFIRIKKPVRIYPEVTAASPVVPSATTYPATTSTQQPAAAVSAKINYSSQPAVSSEAPAITAPPSNYVPQPFGKVATVYTGKGPTAEAITPDGKYLYVINTQSSTLSVIDVAKDKVVKTIKVGGYPDAVKISPNGHYCFVVNSSSNTVTVISTGRYY